jgi:hypothetical protein
MVFAANGKSLSAYEVPESSPFNIMKPVFFL